MNEVKVCSTLLAGWYTMLLVNLLSVTEMASKYLGIEHYNSSISLRCGMMN